MQSLIFDNRFVRELPGDPDTSVRSRQVVGACWSPVEPTPVSAPVLVAHSPEVAKLLDLDEQDIASETFAQVFSGNLLHPGMQPYAACYGGHQFGNWAGQLGDGRAIGLGETINSAGERWELQLKGAGPTPYSRRADGRAVLRSSIREFLCSEAMHHLGIPTTRALSVVATGDPVMRDMFYDGHPRNEPGAVVCRVSPSFIRFGNFEIFAARGEKAVLEQLIDFTISRDFRTLASIEATTDRREAWFAEVCERTARLTIDWMRVGFVHGVMNTDNMSILGLTIDYGPYGWIDNFDPGWTPNTTDSEGRRYCFGRQPEIARWNLERLADALFVAGLSTDSLNAGLLRFDQTYAKQMTEMLTAKFGFGTWRDEDAGIVDAIFDLMQHAEIDMTDFFRRLADVDIQTPDVLTFRDAFYREELFSTFREPASAWLKRYARRISESDLPDIDRRASMNSSNPRFVLRNYIAQEAIDLAEQGDYSLVRELVAVIKHPYDHMEARNRWYAKRPDWARQKAGCSMLSCSS